MSSFPVSLLMSLISLEKCLCWMDFRIDLSASSSSLTLDGPFSCRQLYCLYGLFFSIIRCIQNMLRFNGLNEEKCVKRSASRTFGKVFSCSLACCVIKTVVTSFFTSLSLGSR